MLNQDSRKRQAHKLGSKRNEMAANPRKHDNNFSQSKDIREDRGTRQSKSNHSKK